MTWSRIRRQARCAFDHAIWPGQWALFGRPGFVICEQHAAEKYDLLPPSAPRLVGPERDAKMRQAGEGEP